MRNLGRVERVFMVVPPLLAVLIAVLAPKLWPLHHIPGYWRPVVVLIGLGLDAEMIILSHAALPGERKSEVSDV